MNQSFLDYYNLQPLFMAIHSALCSVMPEGLAIFLEGLVVGVVILLLYAVLAIILIYMERKVCAAFQCRIGPNRVGGRGGLLQVPADVLKILTKEIIGVLGILLAGWSSNSKYTIIGAVRSGAMIISYELSIGITVLTMVLMSGTMDIQGIVNGQADGWNIFKGHIPAIAAFIIYLIAGNAEANRGPFDLAEAEQELTAGYHTEYSGMHFGFFYLAEYLNLFITAGIASTLFLGGWMPFHIAGLDGFNAVMDYIPGVVWFVGKTFVIVFLLMWIRWTFPRLRIDQVLTLEWKYLMPLSLVVLLVMAVCKVCGFVF